MDKIYRTYKHTEVTNIAVNVECPHCGYEFLYDDPECGKTYKLKCGEQPFDDEGCGKEFEMHFDTS